MTENQTNEIYPMRDLENRLLFSDPKNKRALLSLIQATLGIVAEDATVLDGKTIRPKENNGKARLSFTEVDVLATLPDKKKIIIEFQVRHQSFFGKRAFIYALNKFAQQLEILTNENSSANYSDVYPVYIVSILEKPFFKDFDGFFSEFGILEKTRHLPLLDEFGEEMLKLVFVEISKFSEEDSQVDELLKDWVRHFSNKNVDKIQDENVKFAQNVLKHYAQDKEVQMMIEQQKLEEMALRQEGEEQGILEGKIQVALNMIKMKLGFPQIAEATGLSLDVIKKIQEDNHLTHA